MSTTKIEMIYKGTRDGWNSSDFSNHCFNKGPTFVLVKSSAGRVFGGFTSVFWAPSNGLVKQYKNAVIFSVDSFQKFPTLHFEQAIYLNPIYGPTFWNGFGFIKSPIDRLMKLHSQPLPDPGLLITLATMILQLMKKVVLH